jgi:hypothetical protein
VTNVPVTKVLCPRNYLAAKPGQLARRVAAGGGRDLDHVGAEIGEYEPGARPHDRLGECEDAEAGKRRGVGRGIGGGSTASLDWLWLLRAEGRPCDARVSRGAVVEEWRTLNFGYGRERRHFECIRRPNLMLRRRLLERRL